ncbi:MAG: transposase [Sodalis sp. (in: enterobacteria)]
MGNVVIMDNLAAHKVYGVREAIGDKDTLSFYLPPCSVDLNLIKIVFLNRNHCQKSCRKSR